MSMLEAQLLWQQQTLHVNAELMEGMTTLEVEVALCEARTPYLVYWAWQLRGS